MKNWIQRTGIYLLVACLLVVGAVQTAPTTAYAKTKGQKALDAYYKMLSADTFDWDGIGACDTKNFRFCVADINGDGIKELILENNEGTGLFNYNCVYTYVNGKVKHVLTTAGVSWYKKANVLYINSPTAGTIEEHYYKITKSGKAKEKLSALSQNGWVEKPKHKVKDASGETWYYTSCVVNGKEVSWSKYKKARSKLLGTEKQSTFKMKNNTKKNRDKYLTY